MSLALFRARHPSFPHRDWVAGLDVSDWQPGTTSWWKDLCDTWATSDPVNPRPSYAIIKVSEGRSSRQDYYRGHVEGAHYCGVLDLSAYHYSYPRLNSAKEEFDNFWTVYSRQDTNWVTGVLDVEEPSAFDQTVWVNEWLDRFRQAAQIEPVCYGANWHARQFLLDKVNGPWWNAQYTAAGDDFPDLPTWCSAEQFRAWQWHSLTNTFGSLDLNVAEPGLFTRSTKVIVPAEEEMPAVLVKSTEFDGGYAVFVTDGVHRRHAASWTEIQVLQAAGAIKAGAPVDIPKTTLLQLVPVGGAMRRVLSTEQDGGVQQWLVDGHDKVRIQDPQHLGELQQLGLVDVAEPITVSAQTLRAMTTKNEVGHEGTHGVVSQTKDAVTTLSTDGVTATVDNTAVALELMRLQSVAYSKLTDPRQTSPTFGSSTASPVVTWSTPETSSSGGGFSQGGTKLTGFTDVDLKAELARRDQKRLAR